MRVTHVITRLVVGGAQENTVSTVLGLRSKPDVEVDLISGATTGPEGSMQTCFNACPQVLTLLPTLVRPVAPWCDLQSLHSLTRMFRNRRPDIVHTHSGKAGILGRLAARRAGIPIILHHIHGPSFGPFQGKIANWAFTKAERFAGAATTHFVCSANALSRIYLAAGIGRPELYTRVFSGFDIGPFLEATNDLALRSELRFALDDFVIGKIARLSPLKGHEDLFLAFQALLPQCPHAKLLLVGGGPLRIQLEERAKALGLADKVAFTGLVPPSEVARYAGIMDCLAHLSAREGLPRALPQALAACKPVISYDLYGANEVCFHGQTGYLVRKGDRAAVTRHFLELAQDAKLRAELGCQGRKIVRELFSIERMVDEQYEIYLRLTRNAN